MARPLRIEYPGAWYHVTCRGNERRNIFKGDSDRLRFLDILATTSHLHAVEVHAYVLMDNHFHAVLMTHEANLRTFMHHFNTTYTVYFNRRYRRSGHLYQGRYKAVLIDAESYLLELSRYVHLNPVRIKKHATLPPEEKSTIIARYPWSSYRGYCRHKDRQGFVTYSKILEMVGGRDVPSRYSRFVLSGISEQMDRSFWEGVRGQAILGSESFVDWVRERFLSKEKGDRRELPALKALQGGPESAAEIAQEVASRFGVSEKDLYRRYASCRDARSIFLELCCLYLSRKMNLSQIGRELGEVSGAALSQNRKRLAAKISRDDGLREQFKDLRGVWDFEQEK
jgi:putative transposase